MNNEFDKKIIALHNEILALKQSKLKTISQIKFQETTISNIEVQGTSTRKFKITPKNNVFPLLTGRIKFITSDIDNTWVRTGWEITSNSEYVFKIYIDSNSPTTTAIFDIILTSTSELDITEI